AFLTIAINIDPFPGGERTSRTGFSLSGFDFRSIPTADRLKPVLRGSRNACCAGFETTKTKDGHGCSEISGRDWISHKSGKDPGRVKHCRHRMIFVAVVEVRHVVPLRSANGRSCA